jgi:hypothetical protein
LLYKIGLCPKQLDGNTNAALDSLENGVLYIDTDDVSVSIGVDWLQVEKVDSTGTFQVVLKNCHRVAGTFAKLRAEEAPNSDFSVRMHAIRFSFRN